MDPVTPRWPWSATTGGGRIDLPFPFFFYGATYSRAFVSTNGHLNFLASSTTLSNVADSRDRRCPTPPSTRSGMT